MSEKDTLDIEVDGITLEARPGQMLIEVTDAAGLYIPRFCYHSKLSIAANCRMCLVEVEKAPKPLPACATPVAAGMVVQTRSAKAIAAQKATMEFLLINHPLDCPICDQGGECELQDLAMGFGREVSRFTERKRVVHDKNIGPLISTDMTRCIHCTRCVRFGEEIQGIQELGTIGRTENMLITTYVERAVKHEMSGNIIDLCPVGALNSKPFRYRSRSWEMVQRELVSPHDCVGSNLYAHVQRGKLMRVVPRPNDAINETWIADRDRFSYDGVYSADRLPAPMLRVGEDWQQTDWKIALAATVEQLQDVLERDGPGELGVLVSPSATVEECALLSRIARGLGSDNIDHRLRMTDFRDQDADPLYPSLGIDIAELERQQGILMIGSSLRHEAPIIAHRVRKAALAGARVSMLNPPGLEFHFPLEAYLETQGTELVTRLDALLNGGGADKQASQILSALEQGDSTILLGHLALRHGRFAEVRALAAALAEKTGSTLGFLSEGANSAGAHLAGALPHRVLGGERVAKPGLNARSMLEQPRKAYLLFGLEPEADCFDSQIALEAVRAAECVIALTPFTSAALRSYASVALPIGTFAETDGSFVNVEGRWQSFEAVANLVADARAGWKVLRVLAERLGIEGIESRTWAELHTELRAPLEQREAGAFKSGRHDFGAPRGPEKLADIPIYSIDPLVRRSRPLQETAMAEGEER